MSVAPEQIRRFAAAVERWFGVRIGDRPAVVGRIIDRRAATRRTTIDAYLARVERGDGGELRALSAEVTVGETYFFRHVDQIHAFAELLPAALARRGRVRVLSAGCSSGEEPYGLAMIARERTADPRSVEIAGIDVNAEALARARRGRFTRWALRAIAPAHEARWFAPEGADLVLAPSIRDAVQFSEANLLDPTAAWVGQPWDVVFCRNVLMYFAEDTARRVVERLVGALGPGGFLFLGHAEALRDYRELGLALCHTHNTFYYCRGSAQSTIAPAADGWVGEIAAATARATAMVESALARSPAPAAAAAPALAPIRALIRAERFVEAVEGLARLPLAAAERGEAMLLRAVVATQTGEVAEARRTCRALLDAGEHAASAHYLLAICDDAAGDRAGSEQHAREALALDPTFAMAGVHLGLLARRRGDRAGTAEHLAQAIGLLADEDPARLDLLGGGFGRAALVALCRAELAAATEGR